MDPSLLIGTWVSLPGESNTPSCPPGCIWRVLDESTCVYEQQTDMGIMISWFQYWPQEGGILRYPLCKGTRSIFKGKAEQVQMEWGETHIIMNGYRFVRVDELPPPDRFDVYPGTRPDANGKPIPHSVKSKLQDLLSEPPNGEQAHDSHNG